MRRFLRKLKFCRNILRSKDSGWIVIKLNAEQQQDLILNKDVPLGASYISVDPRAVSRLFKKLNTTEKDIPSPSLN